MKNNNLKLSVTVSEPSNYQIDITKHGVFLTKITPAETHDIAENQQAYLKAGDVVKATDQNSWYVYRNKMQGY